MAIPILKKIRELSRFDALLCVFCLIFAFTSFVFEPFALMGEGLKGSSNPIAQLSYFYASQIDPLFLSPPRWLRIMLILDGVLFGPLYFLMIYGLVYRRSWIRPLALVYAGAMLYSLLVYFSWEFSDPQNRESANLTLMTLINFPYLLFPLFLMGRFWRGEARV